MMIKIKHRRGKTLLNKLRSKEDKLSQEAADAFEASMKMSTLLVNAVDEMGRLSYERDWLVKNPKKKASLAPEPTNEELLLRLDEITVIALDIFECFNNATEKNG